MVDRTRGFEEAEVERNGAWRGSVRTVALEDSHGQPREDNGEGKLARGHSHGGSGAEDAYHDLGRRGESSRRGGDSHCWREGGKEVASEGGRRQ